ncbi:hypothetical protein AB0L59_07620 [Streptomyces sp. NPDC052109]|uniref:hypothetical protein n=1 Tax=Streptomyces sp. NPDC052109 TaxID=3155527 RepID=UPI00343C531A
MHLADNGKCLVTTGDHPLHRRYVREAAPRDDEGARFRFGLDCLLDGVAARLHLPLSPPSGE